MAIMYITRRLCCLAGSYWEEIDAVYPALYSVHLAPIRKFNLLSPDQRHIINREPATWRVTAQRNRQGIRIPSAGAQVLKSRAEILIRERRDESAGRPDIRHSAGSCNVKVYATQEAGHAAGDGDLGGEREGVGGAVAEVGDVLFDVCGGVIG